MVALVVELLGLTMVAVAAFMVSVALGLALSGCILVVVGALMDRR